MPIHAACWRRCAACQLNLVYNMKRLLVRRHPELVNDESQTTAHRALKSLTQTQPA